MLEARKNLPFLDEPADCRRIAAHALCYQLERDASPILIVVAFSEIHGAHSSAACFGDYTIWTDTSGHHGAGRAKKFGSVFGRRALHEAPRVFTGAQQSLDVGEQRSVAGTFALHDGGAKLRLRVERDVHDAVD